MRGRPHIILLVELFTRRRPPSARRRRQISAFLLPLSFLVLSLLPAAALSQDKTSWSGSVLNLLGEGIPGVEVLAYPAGTVASSVSPGVFRTDERGKFRLSGLQPGPYFLALNKPGYEVLLAQVNTRWISRLTLTLIPGGTALPPTRVLRQNSMDWVLRAPRTDLLKDLEPFEAVAAPAENAGPVHPSAEEDDPELRSPLAPRLPFNGDVEQWFISDPSFAGYGADAASSSGRTTALNLDGELFGRGNWRVGGMLGTLSTGAGQAGMPGSGQDEGAGRLRVAMDYNLSPGDSVRFLARYDRDSFRGGPPSDAVIPSAQEVRTVGYQAGWTRRMEEGSGLEMKVGYLQALGRTPGVVSGAAPDTSWDQNGSLQDRRWEAGAQYGFIVSPEHKVEVRAATRIYSYDQRDEGWVLAPIQPDLSMAEMGQRGWSVSVSGEDAWRISDPLSLTLGLDYHRAASLSGFSAIVPRLGARRESGRLLVQGEVLFRLEESAFLDRGAYSTADAAPPPGNCLGYRAEVLHRLGGSWTVSGHAERNPLGSEGAEDLWTNAAGPGVPAGLLLTDPTSVTDEIGVRVTKRIKGVEGTLGTDQGKVRGRLAARLDGAPIQFLGQGEVRYVSLKASASVPLTDTEVRLNYHRLDGMESASLDGDSYQASRFDLSLLQQLPFLGKRLPADWRVLLAYQTLIRTDAGSLDLQGGSSPERVRRLSGGIGVKF